MTGNEREGLRERIADVVTEIEDAVVRGRRFDVSRVQWADRILSLLTQAQEPVGYVVVYDNGRGDRDIHHGELWDYAEDAQMAADAMNGARNGYTYTVEPVGASPVASAPAWTWANVNGWLAERGYEKRRLVGPTEDDLRPSAPGEGPDDEKAEVYRQGWVAGHAQGLSDAPRPTLDHGPLGDAFQCETAAKALLGELPLESIDRESLGKHMQSLARRLRATLTEEQTDG